MEKLPDQWPAMTLTPVGRVENDIEAPSLSAGESGLELRQRMEKLKEDHRRIKDGLSRLEIFSPWEELLLGIEGFSHVLVLYWPHLIDPKRRALKTVHPMGRKDFPRQGIFATCSPARPNPVLVSAVRLVERRGNTLIVRGFEAVNNSPIIDIKPYVTTYYGPAQSTVPEWMSQIQQELDD